MAAEALGFMARGASGGRAAELVTRDFLGGCAATDDARDAAAVPGKLSLQKHAGPATPRDLNLFPVAAAAATKPRAVTTTAAPAPVPSSSSGGVGGATTTYHSVCTIEKVKTALERFERGKQHQQQQQHSGRGRGRVPVVVVRDVVLREAARRGQRRRRRGAGRRVRLPLGRRRDGGRGVPPVLPVRAHLPERPAVPAVRVARARARDRAGRDQEAADRPQRRLPRHLASWKLAGSIGRSIDRLGMPMPSIAILWRRKLS
ncbi:hypothetical protein BS78_01G135900 [Paspalum vaginatum]|nr:hypothetical protein BS78_01G135900 [Paspalum vaginatum]